MGGIVPIRSDGRGQSNVDFIVGFGVFFLTFTFVIALLPELLSPHAASGGTVVADRAAGTLASGLLTSGTVGTLDATCSAEFFDGSGTSCGFDASEPMTDLIGVSGDHQLNVTLERLHPADGTEIVCHNGTAVVDCSGGTPMARGKSPPGNTQSIRTARRVVSVDGRTLVLRVREW